MYADNLFCYTEPPVATVHFDAAKVGAVQGAVPRLSSDMMDADRTVSVDAADVDGCGS